MSLDNSVTAAAADIAEYLDGGKSAKRMEVMRAFLEAAIWSAAAHAESLPKNAWVDSSVDDSWTRSARGVEVELPDDIKPEQILQMLERLKLGKDNLISQIIPRIKSAPEGDTLKQDLEGFLGQPGYFDKYLAPAAPASKPAMPSTPSIPEKPSIPAKPETKPSLLPEPKLDVSKAPVDKELPPPDVISPPPLDGTVKPRPAGDEFEEETPTIHGKVVSR